MKILPVHHKYVIVNQGLISTAFNFFLNMGIAWFLYRQMDQIPLWGAKGIIMDTVATAFILTMLTCFFITVSVWWTVKMKWIPEIYIDPDGGIVSAIVKLPVIVQGIAYGFSAVVLIAVPTLSWFFLTHTESLEYGAFLWYKAIFAAVLSLIVSPVMGYMAFFRIRRKN